MQVRWLVVAGVLAAAAEARADRLSTILDKPAFTATPAELLEAARLTPAKDAALVVLRRDQDASYDDRGRIDVRVRIVHHVRTKEGLAAAGLIGQVWWPGRQDRPSFRVRVIAPDGTTAELDPSAISDVPVEKTSLGETDEHELRARLPPLQIGSVVEQETVRRDREPHFEGGAVHDIFLGYGPFPVASARVVVSAPVALHVIQRARSLPAGAVPVHAVTAGRERWSYAIGALGPPGVREADMPPDIAPARSIITATGASWKAVATAYRTLVDRRIAEAPVSLPAGMRKVEAIVAWTHAKVRTLGFSLDEMSHVPATPDATLKRGAGTSLDKATLLVALVRQAGMRADIA